MSDIKTRNVGFSEMIPNLAGLPGNEVDSSEILKGHDNWRKQIREMKEGESKKGFSYWKKISSCGAL